MIAAVGFGLLTGWGLGRRPQDRTLMLIVEAVTLAIGAVVWLTGPASGTERWMAAMSLTLGGAAAMASTLALGRRGDPAA